MTIHQFFAAALVAFVATGCNRAGEGAQADDHAHEMHPGHETEEHQGHEEGENLLLAAYSTELEVFAEAAPFVAGRPGDILAHFTRLDDFKPLAGGTVTASLVVGTDQVQQTLAEPTRPGIYRLSLTPTTAGAGRLVFDLVTAEGALQVVIPDIMVYADEHEAEHEAAEAALASASGAVFTKEQSWKVDFSTEEVRREPFGAIIRTTGQIQPSPGDERIVVAKTGGIVLFSGDNLVEGRAIGAGQALFTIDGSALAEGNLAVRWAGVESEYNRAKAEYERKAALAESDIVSQSDLLRAETEWRAAEAAYNSLRGNFSAGRQTIASPIGGYITRVSVRGGQYVEAGAPVLVVSQNRDLFIEAGLQPRYFDLLGGIVSANFRVLNSDRTYTLEELGGRVVSYGRSTDPANPLIPVIFQVNNRAGLLPGSFVELFIETENTAEAITVPNESIVEEMGTYFVYVQLTPEFFEKRPVEKGVTDGIRTEIIKGVSAGDRVVGRGAILVKLSQASGALDAHAGHVH